MDSRPPREREEDRHRARERDGGRRSPPERARPDRRSARTVEAIARLAVDYVTGMTGKEPETITSLERTDDDGWRVDVEVIETRRIPDSTDILAVYEAELDADGQLLAYRRVQRYSRCQARERD